MYAYPELSLVGGLGLDENHHPHTHHDIFTFIYVIIADGCKYYTHIPPSRNQWLSHVTGILIIYFRFE